MFFCENIRPRQSEIRCNCGNSGHCLVKGGWRIHLSASQGALVSCAFSSDGVSFPSSTGTWVIAPAPMIRTSDQPLSLPDLPLTVSSHWSKSHCYTFYSFNVHLPPCDLKINFEQSSHSGNPRSQPKTLWIFLQSIFKKRYYFLFLKGKELRISKREALVNKRK